MINDGDLGNDDDFDFDLEENKSEEENVPEDNDKKEKSFKDEMEDGYESIGVNELIDNNPKEKEKSN